MNKMTMWLAAAGLAMAPAMAATPVDPAKDALAKMTPEVRSATLAFEKALHPASGTIQVPGGHATLNLGDQYYFLPADEAKRVLTEAWGNPPDAVGSVLGMVFPKGRHFYDGGWGAVLQYEDSGHIDDKDAAKQDYDAVLADMKASEEEANKAAKEGGYATSHVIGWAQPPSYDASGRTLIWARDIKFDGSDGNTLNYDVRKLARTGVLSINMVDSMDHLPLVRQAAVELGKTASFDGGARYADFDKSTDKLADYGLAGLVAAGAGVAIAKKVGILGILLLFLKKGFVILLVALAGGWRWIKRKLGWGADEVEDTETYEAPVEETLPAPDDGKAGGA